MKKLILFMTIFLASLTQVLAEENLSLTPSGEIWASFTSDSTKEGDTTVSKMTNSTYALFGLEASKATGNYTTKAILAFEGINSDVGLYELYAALESDSMTYKLGYFDPSDVTQGMAYLPFWGDVFFNGIYITQDNYMGVGFNDLGLDLAVGFHQKAHPADADATEDVGTPVNETVVGLYYQREGKSYSVGFAFVTVTNAVNEDIASEAAIAAGNFGSQAVSFGVNYELTQSIALALNAEQISESSDSTDTVTSMKTNISADYGIDDKSGVTFANSSTGYNSCDADHADNSRTELGYARSYGDIQTGLAYYMDASKCDDAGVDSSSSGIVAGFYIGF